MHILFFVFLAALAHGSFSAGGTPSLGAAKDQIASAIENRAPVDYSKLND